MIEETQRVLGRKIREAREERGITQKDLGDVLDYSAMAISHFENGIRELKLSDLKRLADFFGKELTFFFPSAEFKPATLYRTEPTGNPAVVKSLEQFEQYLNERASQTHRSASDESTSER